ncbi:MAG: hypothetical protein ACI8P9_002222 [Parasphingorhabdus sp.]
MFAGKPVCLELIGSCLPQFFLPALNHLRITTEPPVGNALHIRVWDCIETGISAENFPLSGNPDDFETSEISAEDESLVSERKGKYLGQYDRKTRQLTACVSYADKRPLLHEIGKPLQVLLSVWYLDQNVPLLHAGAVSRNGHGVLMGGVGGSGKTTSSLASTLGGFKFLGDDRLGLQSIDGKYIAHSVFNSVYLDASGRRRFASLQSEMLPPTYSREFKNLLFVHQACPDQIATRTLLKAVLLPKVCDEKQSSYERLSASNALLELAPSSLVMHIGPGHKGMQVMGHLVRQLPCYRFFIGTDLAGVPASMHQLLDELERASDDSLKRN